MIAKREVWTYPESVKVWVGKYRHSHNLLHWHYDCELLYLEKGGIDVFCEKKTHTLAPGELLYIDSEQVHYMRAHSPETTLIVIIFDYEILRPYMGNVRLRSPKLAHTYPIPSIYQEIRDILLRREPFFGAEAAGKIISLMSFIFRNEDCIPRGTKDRTSQRFIELLEDINEKYRYYVFEDAVEFMGMSSAYFSRYFRSSTGTTFSQYLNYVRTNAAIRLLQSGDDLSVTEISDRCGFGTIRNFNRIFRSFTGYNPSTLPDNFILSDTFVYPSEASFNPTLHDCELIESGEAETV